MFSGTISRLPSTTSARPSPATLSMRSGIPMSPESPPADLTFVPINGELAPDSVTWVKVPTDYPCSACQERGGWLPRVWQSNCPVCWGEDPYGENSYCGECEFCC